MPADDLAEANQLLADPGDLDLAVAQRLGFHVIARLAARHGIAVSLIATPGSGITAVVVLPASLFTKAVPPGPGRATAGHGRVRRRAAERHRSVRPERRGRRGDGSGRPPAGPIPGPPSNVAWIATRPRRSQQDAGPTGPDGRWRGWWSPETQAAADGAGGFGATGREVRDNGHDEGARAGVNGGSAHRGGSRTTDPGPTTLPTSTGAPSTAPGSGHCADAADGTGNGSWGQRARRQRPSRTGPTGGPRRRP